MILFISNNGDSLPIVWRLRREGLDCNIYVHNAGCKHNYAGLIPKVTIAELRKTLQRVETVIFDITHVNEKNKQDVALLKIFKIRTGSPTVFGPIADKLKKNHRVIGGSEWTENLEMDRYKGSEIARKIGMDIPETHDFNNLKQGVKFLKARKDRWVFKPDNNQDLDLTYVEKFPGELVLKMQEDYPTRLKTEKIEYMLQKFVDGYEVSTEGWWNGRQWSNLNHTIEKKRLLVSNLGPAIGSQNNTVWIKKNPNGLLVKELKNLGPYLQRAGYIGPVDINAIVAKHDRKPYFLEFTPRFGYDALYCLLSLVKGPIRGFFADNSRVSFHDGFASSARISIPPYPYSSPQLLSAFAKDVPIWGSIEQNPFFWMEDVYLNGGRLKCAGADGILGVIAARGNSMGGSWGHVYRAIDKLRIGAYLQYRTDGMRESEKVYNNLVRSHISIE